MGSESGILTMEPDYTTCSAFFRIDMRERQYVCGYYVRVIRYGKEMSKNKKTYRKKFLKYFNVDYNAKSSS
jgi:hypothetical protein